MLTAAILLLGILVDRLLGEPNSFHPLVGFGKLAIKLEYYLNNSKGFLAQLKGTVGLFLMVIPLGLGCALAWWWLLDKSLVAAIIFATAVLYLSIGWRSLSDHINAVEIALKKQNLSAARIAVQRIVSRDCRTMNKEEIVRASLETLLENTSDAVIAPLFWFAILGPAGAVIYRLSNTLDAMWGYRTERFNDFGRAAARWDDLINLIPARITAACFAMAKNPRGAFYCWKKYARNWDSPNAGPVICAGSGSLNVSLGGGAIYNGKLCSKPATPGRTATPNDISNGIVLVRRAVLMTLSILCALTIFVGVV